MIAMSAGLSELGGQATPSRAQLVRQRTREKNQVHAILIRNLKQRAPAADLSVPPVGKTGGVWSGGDDARRDLNRHQALALVEILSWQSAHHRPADRSLHRLIDACLLGSSPQSRTCVSDAASHLRRRIDRRSTSLPPTAKSICEGAIGCGLIHEYSVAA